MCKKAILFILASTFLLSITLGSYTTPKVFATPVTLHVYSSQSIQEAIDDANPGDVIRVFSGVYNENIIVDKSISLIGEDPSNTIIDGKGKGRDVVLIRGNNVKIEGFTIQNGEGLQPTSLSIWRSSGHTISNNVMKKSSYGIKVRESNSSNIINNVIANNTIKGVFLSSSNGNNIVGNLIEKNVLGASQDSVATVPNRFYHNNFINNTGQASIIPPVLWDNGAEGNYWSDYHGQDLNGDGIGDTGEIPHLGYDRYPLIERWNEKRDFYSSWKEVTYHTIVQSNSTVASFNFTYSLAQISFNVTGPQNAVSFCNVTIDKLFLDGNFTVLVNNVSKSYVSTGNSTHTTLYFTFSHNSTRKIQVKGTKVIGNTIPSANFTYSPTDPREGQDMHFNSTSADSDGAVVAWLWNLGDGNTSSQQHLIHRYVKAGTYNVTLTVTDNEGATNTITKTIVVAFPVDYTLYYILAGIVVGALILGIAIFLWKKRKKHR